MEKPNNNLLLKSTMTYGALLGLAFVFYSIILVFINFKDLAISAIIFLGLLSLIIMIIGIVWGTKHYRTQVLHGKISYGDALLVGSLIVLFSSIINAFYTYIYNEFIDPTYAERTAKVVMEKFLNFMQNHGFTDEQVEQEANMMKAGPPATAVQTFVSMIIQNTILGFVISLITSAFLKRDKSIFDKEISDTQQ